MNRPKRQRLGTQQDAAIDLSSPPCQPDHRQRRAGTAHLGLLNEQQGSSLHALQLKQEDSQLNLQVKLEQSQLDLQLTQEQPQLVLQLNSTTAPSRRVQLVKGHLPLPNLLATWKEQHHDCHLYEARLVGDAQHPNNYIAIAVPDLIALSGWAASRYRQTGMQTPGTNIVLPVCTHATIVKKLVEPIYSGYVDLGDDVEQLLLLANCMQVKPIEAVCTAYLLGLTLPPARWGNVWILLDRLTLTEASEQLRMRFVQQPWTAEIMAILAVLFKLVLSGSQEAFDMGLRALKDTSSGALCEVQIFDMLWAAGLTQDDRRLPEPFDINRVCPAALEQLLEVIKVPVGSRDMAGCASQELLAGIVKRAKWSESPATEAVWVHKLNCNTSRSFSPAIENLPSVKFCTPNLRAGGAQSWLLQRTHRPDKLGFYFDCVVIYTIYSSLPMVKILSARTVPKACGALEYSPETTVAKFLKHFYHGPWSEHPKVTNLPSQHHSCFGIWLRRRQ